MKQWVKGKVLESGAESHLIYDIYVKTNVVNNREAYDGFQIYLLWRVPLRRHRASTPKASAFLPTFLRLLKFSHFVEIFLLAESRKIGKIKMKINFHLNREICKRIKRPREYSKW